MVVLPLVVGGISAEDAQSPERAGEAGCARCAGPIVRLYPTKKSVIRRSVRVLIHGTEPAGPRGGGADRGRDLTGFVKFLGRTGATIAARNSIAIYLAMLTGLIGEDGPGRVAAMADGRVSATTARWSTMWELCLKRRQFLCYNFCIFDFNGYGCIFVRCAIFEYTE
ncbi:MAG: hypothetical protein ACLUI3_11655 [Christensenellales bacterium]